MKQRQRALTGIDVRWSISEQVVHRYLFACPWPSPYLRGHRLTGGIFFKPVALIMKFRTDGISMLISRRR